MKLLLLFLLISSYAFAQVNENYFFAVINDKDGYVNVPWLSLFVFTFVLPQLLWIYPQYLLPRLSVL